MRKFASGTVLVAIATSILAAGCGGGGSSSPGAHAYVTARVLPGGGQLVNLVAAPSGALAFTTPLVHAHPGRITIELTNGSPLEHNVTLVGHGTLLGRTPTFIGGHRSLTLNLRSGVYLFYCSVPGHRAGGMHGELIVS